MTRFKFNLLCHWLSWLTGTKHSRHAVYYLDDAVTTVFDFGEREQEEKWREVLLHFTMYLHTQNFFVEEPKLSEIQQWLDEFAVEREKN